MVSRSRRAGYYLALVLVTTLLFTLAYNAGMAAWENRPQPLYQSLEIVVQSFTTTGYGEDAPWRTPQMNALVILMQFAGIGLILTAVDIFAVPWLREALTPSAPESVPEMTDHVIVCEHTPRTDAFIAELDARDRDYALIESDPDAARELHERDYRVIEGDPESDETLANAGLGAASDVVIDAADDTSASIALSVREAHPEVRVITLLEDTALGRYHSAAGVDEVLSPRQLLGETLVEQLPALVATDVGEGISIGEDFELAELTVAEGSELCRETVGEAALRERFGVNVVGAWFEGEFETPVALDETLTAGTRLLAAGEPDKLAALREASTSEVRELSPQRIVLAGYGDSGRRAAEMLSGTRSRVTVLDLEAGDGIDVVGDAREPAVLEAAGIADADALVLTVGDDTTAILTALIARELNPELRIVVRANEQSDVEKLYRAGADYVQSLATISGRMLASTVFEDEEVLTYETQVDVVRLPVGDLVGRTLAEEPVRTETGCTIVAVRRGGETITEFDPSSFEFEADDELVLVGPDEAIERFEREYGI